jgi:hypothetical protein
MSSAVSSPLFTFSTAVLNAKPSLGFESITSGIFAINQVNLRRTETTPKMKKAISVLSHRQEKVE